MRLVSRASSEHLAAKSFSPEARLFWVEAFLLGPKVSYCPVR